MSTLLFLLLFLEVLFEGVIFMGVLVVLLLNLRVLPLDTLSPILQRRLAHFVIRRK